MGRWLAETTLTWKEPQWAVRWRAEEEARKTHPLGWLLWVLLFMTVRWAMGPYPLEWNTPAAQWEHLATLSLGLMYASVPWLHFFMEPRLSSPVAVTDKGIRRRAKDWTLLKDIERCDIDVRDVDGHRCVWLDVVPKKGKTLSYAVADTVSVRQLEEELQKQGLPVLCHDSTRHY